MFPLEGVLSVLWTYQVGRQAPGFSSVLLCDFEHLGDLILYPPLLMLSGDCFLSNTRHAHLTGFAYGQW